MVHVSKLSRYIVALTLDWLISPALHGKSIMCSKDVCSGALKDLGPCTTWSRRCIGLYKEHSFCKGVPLPLQSCMSANQAHRLCMELPSCWGVVHGPVTVPGSHEIYCLPTSPCYWACSNNASIAGTYVHSSFLHSPVPASVGSLAMSTSDAVGVLA